MRVHFWNILLPVLAVFLLSTCQREAKQEEGTQVAGEDMQFEFTPPATEEIDIKQYKHNTWEGAYYGILPCDGCPGTEILITLEFDGRSHFSTREYGSDDSGETGVSRAVWDETGKYVSVRDYEGVYHTFLYENDQLILLDENGKKHTGPNASNYILGRAE